jgi:hypothetical protein
VAFVLVAGSLGDIVGHRRLQPGARRLLGEVFLIFTLIYILLPALMVVLSLLLKPRPNRIINIVVSLVYLITIIGSAIGEDWAYCFLGSLIEAILLAAIARTAWKWPPPQIAPLLP